MKIGRSEPQFVEVQVNGHGGIDFLSANSTEEIRTASRSLFRHGVVAYLPTLITSRPEEFLRAAALIEEVRANPLAEEAKILGIHVEGPYISLEKRGVHPADKVRKPDIEEFKKYISAAKISMVTIAPELDGALDFVKFAVDNGIVVSLGHSMATDTQAHAAFDAGATTVTHIWNAMRKLHDEIHGVGHAGLERDDIVIQIIVDDLHVDRATVKETLNMAKGRFILTNDAVAPAGLGDGQFNFGDMQIKVADGQARRLDGTLAGGIGTLAQSLAIVKELGVSESDAIASVTTRPLELMSKSKVVR